MKLVFIDDERFPSHFTKFEKFNVYYEQWNIVRSYDEFINFVKSFGIPHFISFDHDLGKNEKTGLDIAKWIIEVDLDKIYQIPKDFSFTVHSQNPIGKKNIEHLLTQYLSFKGEK